MSVSTKWRHFGYLQLLPRAVSHLGLVAEIMYEHNNSAGKHFVLWIQQYVYMCVYICTMIPAALLSCPASSTNESPRIQ